MPDDRPSLDLNTLEGLYKSMTPRSLVGLGPPEKSSNHEKSDMLDDYDVIMKYILPQNGQHYSYSKIERGLKEYFGASEKLEKYRQLIHIIKNNQVFQTFEKEGDSYWKYQSNGKTVDGTSVITEAFAKSITDPQIKPLEGNNSVSAFLVKTPFITPARRGADTIDTFLNYTPSYFASQLIPYLDVQFQFVGDILNAGNNSRLNAPSMMRFLMGNLSNSDTVALTDADRAMIEVYKPGAQKSDPNAAGGSPEEPREMSFSGMEMFLAPQSLCNMDTLTANGSTRTVDVKPFLPLASIEGVSINLTNAGAGAMAHRTASLKLKIHDKARLGEFSQFIQGGNGFSSATIWMTYGWIAPRNRDSELDAYAQFINQNMLVQEPYTVKNASFSFDATGQVSLAIELTSKYIEQFRTSTLSVGTDVGQLLKRYDKALEQIQNAIQLGGEFLSKAADTRITKLIEGAGTGTLPTDIDLGAAINAAAKRLRDGRVDEDVVRHFEENVSKLKPNAEFSKENINKTIQSAVKNKFNSMAQGVDPFIPSKNDSRVPAYFSKDLVEAIKNYNSETTVLPKKPPEEGSEDASKKTPAPILPNAAIVSFGKVFMHMIAPIIRSDISDVDELQVIFYQFNDGAGPMKNASIAEFPIDIRRLAFAYDEAIKTSGSGLMTAEAFMGLIINSQFSDNRAPGYGMSELYEPYDGTQTTENLTETKDYASKMDAWVSKYGATFTRPVVEMQMEVKAELAPSESIVKDLLAEFSPSMRDVTRDKTKKSDRTWTIARIHIYDKQASPNPAAQQIISTANGYTEGEFAIRKSQDGTAAINTPEQQAISTGLGTKAADAAGRDARPPSTLAVRGKIQNIPRGRKAVMEYVSTNVPSLKIGTNGSLIHTVNVASKTDALIGAINIMRANGKAQTNKPADDASLSPDALPIRTVPAQVTMTTSGVPIAQMYQEYFIDFDTGTTLDNLYKSSTIQHEIGPGKFTTQWTFIFSDAYGRFFMAHPVRDVQDADERAAQKASDDAIASQQRQDKQKKTASATESEPSPSVYD